VTHDEAIDFALREADRLTIEASHARQLGFRELARWLRAQAAGAREWATMKTGRATA
jgi:hypothetical protein